MADGVRVRAVVARVLQEGGPALQDHSLGGFGIADEEVEVQLLRSVGVRPQRWAVTRPAFAECQPRPSPTIVSKQVRVEGSQLLAALSGAGDHDGADALEDASVQGETVESLVVVEADRDKSSPSFALEDAPHRRVRDLSCLDNAPR